MLNVVYPSKCVRESQLFVSLKLATESRSNSRKNDDICCSNILSNEEHSLSHMSVDVLTELSGRDTSNHLNERADFVPNHGVSL